MSWGGGGVLEFLCFDGFFGFLYGIVFVGLGGFKMMLVMILMVLKWGGGLIVFDLLNEVVLMVVKYWEEVG